MAEGVLASNRRNSNPRNQRCASGGEALGRAETQRRKKGPGHAGDAVSGELSRLLDASGLHDAALLSPDGQVLGSDGSFLAAAAESDLVAQAAAGERVLCAWQQTENDGTIGVRVALVDPDGSVVAGPLALNEPGGDDDQRPSLSVRATAAGWEAVVVWETAHGIRGRRVAW